jgi:hypothetical protein
MPDSCTHFYVYYLTTLWTLKIHIGDNRMINDCGTVCGMRIGGEGRGIKILAENVPQCHFVNHESHMP